jgi:hypothetical protein
MNETDEMMQLFPAWREAAKKFLEEEFTPDDISSRKKRYV